jgi:hypothetical protein
MRFLAAVAVLALLATGGVWWLASREAGPAASAPGDPVTVDAIGDQVQTRAGGALPVFAGTGETATLYRFAREQRELLQWMPCACGCAKLGHTSNRSCYVKAESGDRTTWTSHAAT